MQKKVVILPCSGIGKAYGEMGRQAIYELIEDLRVEDVTTTCLARLMIDDPDTKDPGAGQPGNHGGRMRQGLRPQERGIRG